MALVLALMDQGVGLTISIALLGLFLYPDQPILTAATLEIIGTNVSATALGIATFASFIMSATSPVIAGFLYQNLGMNWALFYVSALFAMSGLMMVLIPLRPRVMVSGRT
jgi:MFS family permease